MLQKNYMRKMDKIPKFPDLTLVHFHNEGEI
jgi:hypothetical protein